MKHKDNMKKYYYRIKAWPCNGHTMVIYKIKKFRLAQGIWVASVSYCTYIVKLGFLIVILHKLSQMLALKKMHISIYISIYVYVLCIVVYVANTYPDIQGEENEKIQKIYLCWVPRSIMKVKTMFFKDKSHLFWTLFWWNSL